MARRKQYYSSGTKVQIPADLPDRIQKYRKDNNLTWRQMALRIAVDENGQHLSAHGLANVANKEKQRTAGAKLLANINHLIGKGKGKSTFARETRPIEFKDERRGKSLSVSELVTTYAEIEEADRVLVSAVISRLKPEPNPTAELADQVLELAAKIEAANLKS
tara:strand:- start:18374 stop:18862 length:489 start_codon:yes stop_codon:yes gene_type:complete